MQVNRRTFLKTIPAVAAVLAGCGRATGGSGTKNERNVMTVLGPIRASEMGVTLTHEHVLANFQPYEEWVRNPLTYDVDEVVEVVLPHLMRIRELGCRTFIDATAAFLGRDPALLRRLSRESGLHILTVTGNYAAIDYKQLPSHAFTDSAEALAQRWITEWNDGIDGTGVRPGLMKLGFNGGPLSEVEQKLIRAAALAHRQTGLPVASHTGPAVSAFGQLAILEQSGVHPSAWIWIHAHHEKDFTQHAKAARMGAWISFDGLGPDSVGDHVKMVESLREQGLLHRALVSHDAGWYTVGEPRGGDFRPFDTMFTAFIPALRERGFTDAEIDTLLIENPANAYSIGVRA